MQAIVNEHHGSPDVLQVCAVDRPQDTDAGVLVRVLTTPTTSGDMHLLAGTIFAIRLYRGPLAPTQIVARRRANRGVAVAGTRAPRPGQPLYP